MKFALTLAFLIGNSVYGQNLVTNPGFEEYYNCPGSFNINHTSTKIAPGWTSPNDGTPDLFHECSKGLAGVSHNWAGVSTAHAGKGYIGIYVWVNGRNYREYIQSKLKYPLVEGRKYTIEFYFKLSSYSRYSIDRIGALLLDSAYRDIEDGAIPIKPSFLKVYDSAFRRNSGLWEKVSTQYVSKGKERFLLIGNFSNNESTKNFHINFEPVQEPMLARACYFYIDDVSVVDSDSIQFNQQATLSEQSLKLNQIYVLQNIQFEYNKADLKKSSFPELEKLVTILKTNLGWHVSLAGHTDDVGSIDFNQQLSEARAQRVGLFLVQQGIDKSRITTRGFGKTKPLANGNATAAEKNRRVEITFSQPTDEIK